MLRISNKTPLPIRNSDLSETKGEYFRHPSLVYEGSAHELLLSWSSGTIGSSVGGFRGGAKEVSKLQDVLGIPEGPLDTPEAKLENLLRSMSGREQMAGTLGPILTRRLDVRRKSRKMALSLYTLPCFGYAELEHNDCYDASFPIERIKAKSFGCIRDALDTAMADLFADEVQRRQEFTHRGVEIVPLQLVVERHDSQERHLLGFRLRQGYAVVRLDRVA